MPQLQIFRCPACGGNVNYDGGPALTFPCPFCGTSLAVPEAFRPPATPAAAPPPAPTGVYTPPAPLGGTVLTGLALNIAVVDWLLAQATQQTGLRVAQDPMAYERITKAAEKAMHELSAQASVTIALPFLGADANGPKHFQTSLTRAQVDQIAQAAPKHAAPPPPQPKRRFGF